MSKKIEFNYNGKEYTLEYNREAIMVMEKAGFSLDAYVQKPMLMATMAFEGAFYMHHRKTQANVIQEIYENIGDKEGLNKQLISMINEAYEYLFDSENKNDEKNIQWKAV